MSDSPDRTTDWDALLAAARGGSGDALGRLLDDFRPYLLAVANGSLDADLQARAGPSDLVQDSMLECHEHFGAFTGGRPEELRAWLRQTLLFNLANLRRRHRDADMRDVDREVPLPAADPDGLPGDALPGHVTPPEDRAARHERAEAVRRAIARLPEHYRDVVTWHEYDGQLFAEIGERLGRTAEAARLLWWRALQQLRRDLGEPP